MIREVLRRIVNRVIISHDNYDRSSKNDIEDGKVITKKIMHITNLIILNIGVTLECLLIRIILFEKEKVLDYTDIKRG